MEHTTDIKVPSSKIWLKVSGDSFDYSLSWSEDGTNWHEAGRQKACYLSSETNWGFTGVMIGLYAYSPSEDQLVSDKDFHADFEYFEYKAE
jgi:alpha-N-arabinofuranosidase